MSRISVYVISNRMALINSKTEERITLPQNTVATNFPLSTLASCYYFYYYSPDALSMGALPEINM
jgi:hypothetical protein